MGIKYVEMDSFNEEEGRRNTRNNVIDFTKIPTDA